MDPIIITTELAPAATEAGADLVTRAATAVAEAAKAHPYVAAAVITVIGVSAVVTAGYYIATTDWSWPWTKTIDGKPADAPAPAAA